MKRAYQKGMTLLEVLLAGSIAASMCLLLVYLFSLSVRKTQQTGADIIAQQTMDNILRDIRRQFQKRDWKLGTLHKDVEPAPLGIPAAFRSPQTQSNLNCPAGEPIPQCKNLSIFQLFSTVPFDTHQEVRFETVCQDPKQSPALPTGSSATDFQSSDGDCATLPQLKMITTKLDSLTPEPPAETLYTGDKILGTSACFRSCAGSGDYQVELAVSYQGASSEWKMLKATVTLNTSDVSDDIQIIPSSPSLNSGTYTATY